MTSDDENNEQTEECVMHLMDCDPDEQRCEWRCNRCGKTTITVWADRGRDPLESAAPAYCPFCGLKSCGTHESYNFRTWLETILSDAVKDAPESLEAYEHYDIGGEEGQWAALSILSEVLRKRVKGGAE